MDTPAPRRLVVAAALALLCSHALAHGGQYRGPTDNLPSSPQTSGSGSKGSGGSSNSGSNSGSGSSTSGGSSSPSTSGSTPSAGAGRALARGVQIEPDPVGWETWWEFQKDPLVRLRESFLSRAVLPEEAMLGTGGRSVRTIDPPTQHDVKAVVVPALHRALRAASDRDTITGCMVALAKIGQDVPGGRPGDVFRQHLRSKDQEVRETAALCLGLDPARTAADIGLLVDLVLDRAEGRAAADRSEMDERTRAFAAYGLGVALAEADGAGIDTIVDALLSVLASPTTSRNLTVASIAALAQLDPSPRTGRSRERVLLGLEAFYLRQLGPGEQLLQAHCPTAIARLTGRSGASAARLRERFARDLESSLATQAGERSNNHLAQSCAIALGLMAEPWNTGAAEPAIPELLLSCYRNHRDHQTRYFAVLALGRLGGDAARAALLRELSAGNRTIEQPWIALALGLLEHGRFAAARESGSSSDPDHELGAALLALLGKTRNPSSTGGVALAVGLASVPASGDRLRAMLRDNAAREDLAGPIAIALAIQDERRAAVDLHELLPRCVRRPQLLVQVATALGRLGDGEVVPQLTAMLGDGDVGLARLAAVAGAIGQIGDRNCIPPLVALLGDDKAMPLARAFAAVALGGICDPAPLPWNARFAYAVNYRAAVETLTDGSSGILDIL